MAAALVIPTTIKFMTPRHFQVEKIEVNLDPETGEGTLTITPLPGRRPSDAPLVGHLVVDDGETRSAYDIKMYRGKPIVRSLVTKAAAQARNAGGSES